MEEPVNYEALESFLRALSYSSRLELISLLRRPHALNDIRLVPRQLRPGDNPERLVSRQTLQLHIDKLMGVGLVEARDPTKPGRRGKEYFVNAQRFYQVLEEFRKIGMLTTGTIDPHDATVALGTAPAEGMPPGPKLLLVHGLARGQAYPLDPDALKDGRGWVIGRKRDIAISLSYDPYVSLENAEIVPGADGGYELIDLRTSKNGTWLNWHRLEKGESKRLVAGDVIEVGRSALVFRAE